MEFLSELNFERKRWRWSLLFVFAVAVFLHFDAINIGMVFDDHFAVQTNRVLLDGFDLKKILFTNFWGDNSDFSVSSWRPLVTLTYALNYAVHGMDPAGYHLVDLVLHGIVTLLVALFAETLGVSRLGALIAALLFAAHPIHVEAVVPIVGRADLMLGAFGIGALLLWEKRRTVAAAICLVLALYSKEMGVVVAGIMVWQALTRDGRLQMPRGFVWTVPLIITSLWLVTRYCVLGGLGETHVGALENPLVNTSFWVRLWTSGAIYLRLIGLMVFPKTLLREYSYAVISPLNGPNAASIVGLLLLALSIVAVIAAALKGRKGLSVVLALWTGGYLLVSHLGPALPMIFAERIFYLPSAGAVIAVMIAVGQLVERRRVLGGAYAILVVLFFAAAARSVVRMKDWKDDMTLIEKSLEDSPNCVKALVLSAALLNPNGRITDAEALSFLKRAIQLKENHALPHVEIAKYYVTHGLQDEALKHIRRAEALAPNFHEVYSVKCAYASRYDLENALEICGSAVKMRPDNPNNWSFLAIALDHLGKPEQADKSFRTALEKMDPPRADILLNYGVFLAVHGRYAGARRIFESVLQINPEDKDARAYIVQIDDTTATRSP